ncbi:MAG: hypothetical protein HYR74_10890 [Candidatus Eisenbacteria bacterium]|nr:hypothetical protein [Candidatus Eisenbacteria bacterium]
MIAIYILLQGLFALGMPFVGDDFVFLEKVEHASFASLWATDRLPFHYFRPWSREFHFWALLQAFGPNPFAFHFANLLLAAVTAGVYFVFARRIAGGAAAGAATAGVLALASWGVLYFWASGSQDLWMILFAIGALLAFTSGRIALAVGLQIMALISKETSALLPGIALAYALIVERRTVRAALTRTAPLWGVVAVWALFHPMIGGRIGHPIHDAVLPGVVRPPGEIARRTIGSLVNLDAWPRPMFGWRAVLDSAVIGVLPLAALALVARRADAAAKPSARARAAAGRIAAFGGAWALLAWVPLFMPSLGFHAYYALLGALGAWLALGILIAWRPALTVAAVAALVVLRSGRVMSRSTDWGDEWFQRRAALFGVQTLEYMRAHHPSFPPHTRIYVASVPPRVGLVPGGDESPAMRYWYDDPTLEMRFISHYRPRTLGAAAGNDYFFRFDSTSGWRELRPGDAPGRENPIVWRGEQQDLMDVMLNVGDWAPAAAAARGLAAAFPDRALYAYDLGVCYARLGRADSAALWIGRAAALPDATPEMREARRSFGAAN